MRPLRTCLFVLAALVLGPSNVWADSSISWGSTPPNITIVGSTVTVSASGSYTLDGTATLKSVTFYAVFSEGGVGGQGIDTASSGTWSSGTITLSGLANGTYTLNIYARLYVTVCGADQYYDTPVKSFSVSICGCGG
jgi:hypothetical protein